MSVAGGASRRERERYTHALMGTLVTIEVVGHDRDARARRERGERVTEAFEWFRRVEGVCTRFDPASELMRLTATIDVPVPVSDILFHAVEFACAVARETSGAFDPTVGHAMEQLGFDTAYDTGLVVHTPIAPSTAATYRDILINTDRQTVTLTRPLVLDLGGVAKGLAIDLAAEALRPLRDFAIDAGGDLFLGGHNADDAPWSVGIRHPREEGALLDDVHVSDVAVCTSGDYERRAPAGHAGHHIDPRTSLPVEGVASVTVIAPKAMVADAFGTAAFVLGPHDGLALFERIGVDGLVVSTDGRRFATAGMSDALLSHA